MSAASFPRPEALEEEVVVYLTRWCPYCSMARRLLETRGIRYAGIDVAGDGEARRWLAEASGQRTVPQVFIKGESIGGFEELAALDQSGELRERLAT